MHEKNFRNYSSIYSRNNWIFIYANSNSQYLCSDWYRRPSLYNYIAPVVVDIAIFNVAKREKLIKIFNGVAKKNVALFLFLKNIYQFYNIIPAEAGISLVLILLAYG